VVAILRAPFAPLHLLFRQSIPATSSRAVLGPRLALAIADPGRFITLNAGLDLLANEPDRSGFSFTVSPFHKEGSMFRTALSIVAVASLLAALPSASAAAQAKASSRAAAKPSTSATVNLNTASAVDLEALPGIGAKTAARIVEYRQKNGPFKKIEELMNVRGVGEKNFLKLKPQITVGTAKADHDDRQQP
jgi:competence protein ComEA